MKDKFMTHIFDNDDAQSAFPIMQQSLADDAAAWHAARIANSPKHLHFIICDFEYSYDNQAFKEYQIAEHDETEGRIRWPFHTMVAAAWCMMTLLPDAPNPIITNVRAHVNKSEKEIAEDFFGLLSAFPDSQVVTWGGETKDFAVLRRIAMSHGLALPPQLRDPSPFSRSRIDLLNAVRGQANHVHLPELSTAMGIDSKPMPARQIGLAVQLEQWDFVEQQVVADVCTIARLAWRFCISTVHSVGDVAMGDEWITSALKQMFPDDTWLARQAATCVQ
jgi:Predicted 3'-5' exonuclease related to the exonuclease domain of PolB